MQKKSFIRRFQKRFLLRFHMSLILLATCLSGVLFSKLLFLLDVRNVLIRYPLTACLAYLLFFLFIKLWLWYVSTTPQEKTVHTVETIVDTADIVFPDLSGPLPSSVAETMLGSGGRFGGGGASGSYGDIGETAGKLADKAGDAVGDTVGDLVPDLDEGTGLALLVLGLLLAVVLGAGIYLVYSAPGILSEAAFECLLAGTLVKRSKTMDNPDWMGSVLRATWVPFAAVLAMTLVAGWVLRVYYPEIGQVSALFTK